MKKILLLLSVLIAINVSAQKKPELYAVFNLDGTLTVYYDGNAPKDSYHFVEPWNDNQPFFPISSVTTVVFDPSVANYRPTSCKDWFAHCDHLREIKGLEYLNTSAVTDMSGMFKNCYMLESVDLSNFDTRNVTNMSEMFFDCYNLSTSNLCSIISPSVKDTTRMLPITLNHAVERAPELYRINFGGRMSGLITRKQIDTITCISNPLEGYRVIGFDVSTIVKGFYNSATSNTDKLTKNQKAIIAYVPNGGTFYIENISVIHNRTRRVYHIPAMGFTITDSDDAADINDSAYVSYDKGVVVFYYGKERENSVSVHTIANMHAYWEIKKVVFDPSFKRYYPKSCSGYFYGMNQLTEIVDMDKYLNTDSVKTMRKMFEGCKSLESIDLHKFNTKNVTDMGRMFFDCEKLTTLDLSNFDFDNVTCFSKMFAACKHLKNINAPKVNIDNAEEKDGVFDDCEYLLNVPFCNYYRDTVRYGADAKFITGISYHGTTPEAKIATPYAVIKDSVLTFFFDDNKPVNAFEVNDCRPLTRDEVPYELSFLSEDKSVRTPQWNCVASSIKKVVFDDSFRNYRPKSCYEWFSGCSNLTEIVGIKENLNTENVRRMTGMFLGCTKLKNIDLSGFNTQNVTDMHSMFSCCMSLESLDLSGFKTENLRGTALMFEGCKKLKSLNLKGFSTANVVNMGSMFFGCKSLKTIDVSGFNTSQCENMSYMFAESGITTIDLSSFNAETNNWIWWRPSEKLTGMFEGCKNLKTLDLSHFKNVEYAPGMFCGCSSLKSIKLFEFGGYDDDDDYYFSGDMSGLFYGCSNLKTIDMSVLKRVGEPRGMKYMFANCTKLKTIYVSHNWSYQYTQMIEVETLDGTIETKTIDNPHDNTDMFLNCPKLSGGNGTKYNKNHPTDHSFAKIDGGKDDPGYFTKK